MLEILTMELGQKDCPLQFQAHRLNVAAVEIQPLCLQVVTVNQVEIQAGAVVLVLADTVYVATEMVAMVLPIKVAAVGLVLIMAMARGATITDSLALVARELLF
tara:strand:+ start:380 stop:691 length:312 start_codon:yes stop_codon:yes gene_type:complete